MQNDEMTEAMEELEDADMEAAMSSEENAGDIETDSLNAEIERLTKELALQKDVYLRMAAEYDNFRKRSTKDRLQAIANTKASDVAEILSVTDNLARALSTECSDANYKKGVEMIASQFEAVIKKLGVTEIEAVGKPFDPNFHNAINSREDENFPDNTVCEVLQKGYLFEDKVIRPALVVVANP
jgi:molecular chaperone GrpE